MKTVLLSLGSNLGDRIEALTAAIMNIKHEAGQLTGLSHIYETSSWGSNSQKYLNMVIQLSVEGEAEELWERIRQIELSEGKIFNDQHFSDRTIDIDILDFDGKVFVGSDLCIPHPLFHLRNFCVIPLMDIDTMYIHPVFNMKIQEIAELITDKNSVKIFMNREDFMLILKHGNSI